MLFNSLSFLVLFLPVAVFGYWSLPAGTARKYWLVGASYVFYGAWSPWFALLMLGTTSVDYFTARRIEQRTGAARRGWLAFSLVCNLGTLGLFKYFDFFATTVNTVAGSHAIPLLDVVLPIGISFYTFESVSYTIDVYRGVVPALRRFIDYAHFVTMFPRLVAGPIVRYADLASQLRSVPETLPVDRIVTAVHFFSLGIAKKVLVADPIAGSLVTPLFSNPDSLHLASAWTGALAYTAQLYFDFSGYSDMAVGLGHLFGFDLPRNFRLPYAAASISEFWRRWHVSLSGWLRDYLYIPLGGNRHGVARGRLNLFVTMLLGGLWHGAAWTFVIWGALHGAALVVEHSLRGRVRVPYVAARAATFLLVVALWVPFRAASVGAAASFGKALIGWRGVHPEWLLANPIPVACLLLALAASMTTDTYELISPAAPRRWAVASAVLLAGSTSFLDIPSPFLYYQF